MSRTLEEERDRAYALIAGALTLVATWYAPDGWHVVVFVVLLLCGRPRRVRIEPEPDE